jgi:hypothetical protein
VFESPNPDGRINLIKAQPITITFPNAKYLYTTEKGKVYALPLDNIPCLVPEINSNMPIVKFNLKGYKKIPNAFPEQKLIPSESLIEPYYKK